MLRVLRLLPKHPRLVGGEVFNLHPAAGQGAADAVQAGVRASFENVGKYFVQRRHKRRSHSKRWSCRK